MNKQRIESVDCLKFDRGTWLETQDTVSPEIQISIHWKGQRHTLWSFPDNLEELALGHAAVDLCAPDELPRCASRQETSFIMKAEPGKKNDAIPGQPWQLLPATVLDTMNSFLAQDGFFKTTGCFHRMGAYSPATGKILSFVEDIGRHNCVDRLAGWSLRTATPLHNLVLFCSSRVTASLMHKISRAGFVAVVSRSATTRAAIDHARARNITLIGFTRKTRFTVFCDPGKRVAS